MALVGLQLGSPWLRLTSGDEGLRNGFLDWQIAGVLGLVAALAAAVVLLVRHRQAGVWAAAAYLLAGAMADLLWALLGADRLSFGRAGDVQALLVVVLPLLVLGLPAAIAALRGSAAGQAAGAVLVTVGAFIPLQALISELPSGGDRNAEMALQISLAPFTPTNSQSVSRMLEADTPALLGVLAMLVLALALLVSTVRRPSAPLTAAVALAVVVAAQIATTVAGSRATLTL